MKTFLLTLLAASVAAYDGEKVVTLPSAGGATSTVDLRWNWEPPMMHTLVTMNSTSNTEMMWFAMGFNKVGTSMVGADYVMGYVTPAGETCVRTLGCEQSPPPNSPPKLQISAPHFSRANGGTYQLAFSRQLASGFNPLVAGSPVTVLFAAAHANATIAPTSCTEPFVMAQAHNFFASNATVITFSG